MLRAVRVIVVAAALATAPLLAQHLPSASPSSVGFNADRLERLHRGMQALIDRHEVGGIVTLLARDGKLADLRAYGWQDVDAKKPMTTDTIFRIASMTKPITSVAVMMLYEEGRLQLTDPVSKYIPSFRDMKVLTRGTNGGEPTTAAARRP